MTERVELDEQFVSLARETCDELRNWLFGQPREALSPDRALSARDGRHYAVLAQFVLPPEPSRARAAP